MAAKSSRATATQRFLQQTGASVLVVCGPMYPGSNPELVAAVSAAGGLGVVQPLTMTYVYGHDFREGLRLIRRVTDGPIGVNFTLMSNRAYMKRMQSWMDIAIEENVKFFLTSLGRPDGIVKRAHEHGITVYHDVATAKFAKAAVEAGVDGLNCVNYRGGGQTGAISAEQLAEELAPFGLPLICAGGVAGKHSFKNALSLGYSGAQVGTRFLATNECKVSDAYKQAIVTAAESNIVWTNKLAGVNSSVISTPDVESGGLRTGKSLSFLLRNRRTKNLARMLLSIRAAGKFKRVSYDSDYQLWQAGKGVGEIDGVESVSDVMGTFENAYAEWIDDEPSHPNQALMEF